MDYYSPFDKGKTYMHACANGDHETADKLYAVDYYNGEIMVAKIDKKKLVAPIFNYKLEGHSIDPKRQNQPHPHFVDFTPDGKRLIVVDLGLDKVLDRKSTRLNSSHITRSRMPSSA